MSAEGAYATALLEAIPYVSTTVDFVTIIIGTIGALCNFITFTAPELRRSACVFCLLIATTFQLLSIIFIIPTRIAANIAGSTLERQSLFFCKLRVYLVMSLPQMATYCILLSTMDRCLATSRRTAVRACSNLAFAIRATVCVALFVFIPNTFVMVIYSIYNNNCQSMPGTVETYVGASYAIAVVIVLPHTLMLILCAITHLHLKRAQQRVQPTVLGDHPRPMHRFELQIIMVRFHCSL